MFVFQMLIIETIISSIRFISLFFIQQINRCTIVNRFQLVKLRMHLQKSYHHYTVSGIRAYITWITWYIYIYIIKKIFYLKKKKIILLLNSHQCLIMLLSCTYNQHRYSIIIDSSMHILITN